MYYAQIDPITRSCIAVTETHGDVVDDPCMIEVTSLQTALLGKIRDESTGEWIDAPPSAPSRILTHLGFRERFTTAEQEWADELEVTFETNPAFTVEQKRALRTGFKNFNLSQEVDLDDPRIPPMLGLYVALGGLAPMRPAEILA